MIDKLFLDKLLKSGAGLASQTGKSDITSSLSSMLKGKGGAAVAGGALGLLLGSKKGRKVGGKVLTYGGMAALGVLAYKAFDNWQQNKGSVDSTASANTAPQLQLQEQQCKAILVAVIAAAKADGHIDDREREIIDAEVAKLTSEPQIIQFVDTELKKPLDPAAVASFAKDQATGAQMYLASLLVIDEESFMEKSYLNELAKQLVLPESLQLALRQQVQEAEQLTQA